MFVGFGASMIGNQEATRFHSPTSLLDVDGFALDWLKVFFVVLTLFFSMALNYHLGKFIVFVSNHRRCTSNSLCFPSKDEKTSLICKIMNLPLVFGAWTNKKNVEASKHRRSCDPIKIHQM